MDNIGINAGFLIVQLLNFTIIGAWLVFTIVALLGLRRSQLTGTVQALWALIVLAIPLLGALAFLIIKPKPSKE